MIYTLTLNPAIDYSVRLDRFLPGEINRTVSEDIRVGGKGINVSIVLKNLGIPNVALGFVAGQTGALIEERARAYGCKTDFIHLEKGTSRINVKIQADSDSAINGMGPQIDMAAMQQLYEKLGKISPGDTLVLSGNVSGQQSSEVYRQIIDQLSGRKISFVVDATKALLTNVLKCQPFFIKPNAEELAELFDSKPGDEEALIQYAIQLHEAGAQNVLVSRGAKGAILVTHEGRILLGNAPAGTAVNTVGAGDSMVAGFLAGCQAGDCAAALRLGIAAGSASAFSRELATLEQVQNLLPFVGIREHVRRVGAK